MAKLYDVLIVGGGPAGLSAATVIVRQLMSALILDSGVYRNAAAKHMHTVAGFDHVDPADFRAKALADLGRYDGLVDYRPARVVGAARSPGETTEFVLTDDKGETYRGRRVILATGIRDKVEEMPEGYAECWGKGIFHCLFCHGYEERGPSSAGPSSAGLLAGGLIATKDTLAHIIPMTKRLSQHVVVYTNGDSSLAAAAADAISALPFPSIVSIEPRRIARFRLASPDGPRVVVTFDDGTERDEGFIASHPAVEQHPVGAGGHNDDDKRCLAEQLGLEVGGAPFFDVKVAPPWNAAQGSGARGVYVAGDAATMLRNVPQAMNMGGFAAAGCVIDLEAEFAKAGTL